MMNTQHNAVIEKVRKLLALSESSNEHEAALAAEKARELLESYDLSLSDVESVPDAVMDKFYDLSRRSVPRWLYVLIDAVSEHFNCKAIYYRMDYENPTVRVRFIGTETDIEITEYVFTYLRRTVDDMTARQSTPEGHQGRRFKNSFRYGVAEGITLKLEQMRAAHERHMPENLKARAGELVVVKTAAVDDFIKNNLPPLRTTKSSFSISSTAYNLGVEKGRQVSINPAVNRFNNVQAIDK
ncbi:MAG: DUF2786 domain-containing protein [Nitrospirae bacterium]|nr:DUF2786 domain-containing protein [Nitrospirota bacterium]